MATEAKFSTVLPNNSLKGAINATPVSQVYQEKTNTLGPLENEFHGNDVQFSLNANSAGSLATVMIPPSYKLLNDVYLLLTIDVGATPANWTSDMVAYKCINQFIYRIPGCERMYFDGQNIPFLMLSNTENIFKKSRHIELAGSQEIGSILSANTQINVVAKLPIPSCSLFGDVEYKPKPVPLHMLGEPLELMIKFQPTYSAMGLNSTGTIKGAQLYFDYGHLGAFQEYKNVIYKQMFDAVYDYEYVVPNASAGGNRSNVLTGVRSGETTMIRVRVKEYHNSDDLLTFNSLPLSDLKLRYAGQLIWQADSDLHGSYHMDYTRDVNYWARKIENYSVAAVGGTGSFSAITGGSISTTLTSTAGTVQNPNVVPVTGVSGATGNVAINAMGTAGVISTLTSGAATGSFTGGSGTITFTPVVDTVGTRNYYYDIPIGTILAYMKKNGYVLGADFNNSELKLDYIIAGTVNGVAVGSKGPATPTVSQDVTNKTAFFASDSHYLEVTQFVNSIYQYNGERAVLIQ